MPIANTIANAKANAKANASASDHQDHQGESTYPKHKCGIKVIILSKSIELEGERCFPVSEMEIDIGVDIE